MLSVDPLFAFSFLQCFVEILQEYFGTVSAAILKDNFDVVYQVRNPNRQTMWMLYLCLTASRRNPRLRRPPIDHFNQRTS